jgi:hypothetical protein
MPMRRGGAPWTAASTMSGAKNAKDILMWTDGFDSWLRYRTLIL